MFWWSATHHTWDDISWRIQRNSNISDPQQNTPKQDQSILHGNMNMSSHQYGAFHFKLRWFNYRLIFIFWFLVTSKAVIYWNATLEHDLWGELYTILYMSLLLLWHRSTHNFCSCIFFLAGSQFLFSFLVFRWGISCWGDPKLCTGGNGIR